MPDQRKPPYHIGEQYPVALLPPVVATLGELQARLNQYVERLHLSDADRTRLAAARDAVSEARSRVDHLLREVAGEDR